MREGGREGCVVPSVPYCSVIYESINSSTSCCK